jgi:hypothetical protein
MAEYAEIVPEVKKILTQYHVQMTLRQIYYRLVAREVIPNNINSYKGLSRILVKAREVGDIPDDCMEDRARTTIGGDYGSTGEVDPAGFVRSKIDYVLHSYNGWNRSMWEDQPDYVEVWVEKDALSQLVSGAISGYRVKTCIGRGYSSYSYVREAVNRFAREEDKSCTVIYLGDWDPSGLDITRDLGRRLSEYGAPHVNIERIALTKEQIKQYKLPPAPVKTTDARANGFIAEHGRDVVELDALEPPVLEKIVKDAVVAHVDADAWEATKQRVKEERDMIKDELQKIRDLFPEYER